MYHLLTSTGGEQRHEYSALLKDKWMVRIHSSFTLGWGTGADWSGYVVRARTGRSVRIRRYAGWGLGVVRWYLFSGLRVIGFREARFIVSHSLVCDQEIFYLPTTRCFVRWIPYPLLLLYSTLKISTKYSPPPPNPST